MKKIFLMITMFIMAHTTFAQHLNLRIQNIRKASADSIYFDLVLVKVAGDSTKLKNYDVTATFNYAALANGGTITFGYVDTSAATTLSILQRYRGAMAPLTLTTAAKSHAVLLAYARNIIDSLDGNARYSSPSPSLIALTALADNFEDSIATGRLPGIATSRALLVAGITTEAAYVAATTVRDVAGFISAGFDVVYTGPTTTQNVSTIQMTAPAVAIASAVKVATSTGTKLGTYYLRNSTAFTSGVVPNIAFGNAIVNYWLNANTTVLKHINPAQLIVSTTLASPAYTSSVTVTPAQLATGLLTVTSGTNTLTLPTATELGTYLNATAGTIMEFQVLNIASGGTVTIAVGTNIVASGFPGTNTLTLANSATVGIARFRISFMSATTATLARIN